MKLHNVIGGLEEKNHICLLNKKGEEHRTGIDWKKKGHNQLCNREVEVDVENIEIMVNPFNSEIVHHTREAARELAKLLAKAIEQGKVIKVVK